jgi:hypothetical protein
MTGVWQVMGSAHVPMREMVEIDTSTSSVGRCGWT